MSCAGLSRRHRRRRQLLQFLSVFEWEVDSRFKDSFEAKFHEVICSRFSPGILMILEFFMIRSDLF